MPLTPQKHPDAAPFLVLFYLPLHTESHPSSSSFFFFWSLPGVPPVYFSLLCQVRSWGVIGRSIRHSALGTLAALIRSLGLLTSQGWMLRQKHRSNDGLSCFVGACKGGGRRRRRGICLVSESLPRYTCFGAFFWCHFCSLASVKLRAALHLWLKMPEGEFDSLGVNLILGA